MKDNSTVPSEQTSRLATENAPDTLSAASLGGES